MRVERVLAWCWSNEFPRSFLKNVFNLRMKASEERENMRCLRHYGCRLCYKMYKGVLSFSNTRAFSSQQSRKIWWIINFNKVQRAVKQFLQFFDWWVYFFLALAPKPTKPETKESLTSEGREEKLKSIQTHQATIFKSGPKTYFSYRWAGNGFLLLQIFISFKYAFWIVNDLEGSTSLKEISLKVPLGIKPNSWMVNV